MSVFADRKSNCFNCGKDIAVGEAIAHLNYLVQRGELRRARNAQNQFVFSRAV